MRVGLLACLAAGMWLPGCASPPSRAPVALPPEPPGSEELRRRAAQLWTAKQAEDWATAYQFEEPQRRAQIAEAAYVASRQENEQFKTHSFELGSVEADGPLGWVPVKCSLSARKFPSMPPRDISRWEKWRVVEGQWYPVPSQESDNYAEAPSRRDRAEEARLLARFEESWRGRQQKDGQRLFELVDPRDRGQVTVDQITESENAYEKLSHQVQWVEAIGERGRVRVVYEIKLNDPNMQKLPTQASPVTERWVKYENEWYIDLDSKEK